MGAIPNHPWITHQLDHQVAECSLKEVPWSRHMMAESIRSFPNVTLLEEGVFPPYMIADRTTAYGVHYVVCSWQQ